MRTKKQKTLYSIFLILILCFFSLFIYYYFSFVPIKIENIEVRNPSKNDNEIDQKKEIDQKINNPSHKKNNSKKKQNLFQCPPCNFTPLFPPTSTRRDVVLAAALNKLKRVETFIRTLRMTGSRCRIILFLDSKKTIEPHFLRFFKSCDIEPVFVNNNNNSVLIGGAKMTRYYYYQQWLEKHVNETDRVLHSDTFDVLFQSDPFRDDMLPVEHSNKISTIEKVRTNMSKNVLYFTFEPVTLGDSKWTASWFSKCYGANVLYKYRNFPVSCSGVTIGYGESFLKYVQIMLGKDHWKKCFGESLDQAHHNYILYNGDLKKAGIEIKALDCNSKFLTMHFCCKRGRCHYDVNSNIIFGNKSGVAPVLVHQYNRWKNLTKRNKAFCPNSAKDLFANKKNSTDLPELAQIERLPPLKDNLPETLM